MTSIGIWRKVLQVVSALGIGLLFALLLASVALATPMSSTEGSAAASTPSPFVS